jgi:N-acetylneuraminic acid mutarotase
MLSASLLGLLLGFVSLSLSAAAQTTAPNEWTWMGGSNQLNQSGVYGVQGVASAANLPGGRSAALIWTDSKGNVWLFGGYGYNAVGVQDALNDLWKFTPATVQWTWVSGSSSWGLNPTGGQPGVYGTLGIPLASNVPGARTGAVGWVDKEDNLWLVGGFGEDSAHKQGDLNDVWEFSPATSEWTWMGGSSSLGPNQSYQPGVYGTLGVPSSANVPGGRGAAMSWTDSSGNAWLFGGERFDPAGYDAYLNDLWEFNPSTNEWAWEGGSDLEPTCEYLGPKCGESGVYGTLQTPAAGNWPGGRNASSACTDKNGNFWLFGGGGFDSKDNWGQLSDVWKFNPSTGQWAWMAGDHFGGAYENAYPPVYGVWMAPGPDVSPGGTESAMSWIDIQGNLWLYNGDLWEFYPSSDEWAWMDGSSQLTSYGSLGVASFLNNPGIRDGTQGWTDSNGNFWLFGGGGHNDLWEYQPYAAGLPTLPAPQLSPAPGTYTSIQSVTLSDSNASAPIYYIINQNPTPVLYTGPINVVTSETIQAVAGDLAGYAHSPVSAGVYTLNLPPAATPIINPPGGTYSSFQTVTITDSISGATVFYTPDGTTPTNVSTQYSGSITIESSETIQAIAIATGYSTSAVASATYILNLPPPPAPTFSLAPGSYYGIQNVTINDAESYATIYYTTDGTTPTVNSNVYSGSFGVGSTETIQAIAVVSGGASSTVASGTYTILPVPPNTWIYLRGSTILDPPQPGNYGQRGLTLGQNYPGSRAGSATWTAKDGSFWLMGGKGYDSAGNSGWLNDLWKFDPSGPLQDDEWTWMGGSNTLCTTNPADPLCAGRAGVYGTLGTPAANNMPGGREGPATWTDSNGNFWLFGGYGWDATGLHESYLNDLWMYSPSSGLWTWMGGSNTAQYYILAEGYGQPGVYGTLGTPAAGNIPSSREYAATWMDSSGNLWMFGGQGFTVAGQLGQLNDLWEFDPITGLWTWISGSAYIQVCDTVQTECGQSGIYGTQGTPAASNTPGGRSYPAVWTDSNGNFWLFGGDGFDSNDFQGGLNDLWEFSPKTRQWTWVNGSSDLYCAYDPAIGFNLCSAQAGIYGTLGVPAASNVPGGRSGMATWVDMSGNLWMFGDSVQNDLWMLNPSTGMWTWMGGDYVVSNCVVTFWNGGIPIESCGGPRSVWIGSYIQAVENAPGSRAGAATWVDKNGAFWLFDGQTAGGKINDLWQFIPSAPSLPPAARPVFSLTGGNYIYGGPLTITNGMANATIYYTTDGTTPTMNSTVYQGPLTLSASETVQAFAVVPGYITSGIATVSYTIVTTPPAPTFSVPSGVYNQAQTVSVTDNSLDIYYIYYTTDGSDPALGSTGYSGPITVSSSETINAVAVITGFGVYTGSLTQFYGLPVGPGELVGPDASATYTINLPQSATPTFSVPAGTYTSAQSVTISDSTSGATIHYTTDGTTPTTSSTVYSGPIAVSTTETIQAVATATGYSQSAAATAAYTINLPPPDFSVAASPTSVTVTAGQSGTTTVTIALLNGFNSAVSLSCSSGLPAGASCSFSPSTVTPPGTTSTTLTVTTTASSAALHRESLPLLPGSALAAALCCFGWKKRRRLQMLLLLAVSLAGFGLLTSCGGGAGSSTGGGGGGSQPVTSTVTVTATSGSLTHTTTFLLTVN